LWTVSGEVRSFEASDNSWLNGSIERLKKQRKLGLIFNGDTPARRKCDISIVRRHPDGYEFDPLGYGIKKSIMGGWRCHRGFGYLA